MWLQEDYTTDEEALAAHGVKGGAGGILDLLKASKQVAGLDSATLRLDLLDHKLFFDYFIYLTVKLRKSLGWYLDFIIHVFT